MLSSERGTVYGDENHGICCVRMDGVAAPPCASHCCAVGGLQIRRRSQITRWHGLRALTLMHATASCSNVTRRRMVSKSLVLSICDALIYWRSAYGGPSRHAGSKRVRLVTRERTTKVEDVPWR